MTLYLIPQIVVTGFQKRNMEQTQGSSWHRLKGSVPAVEKQESGHLSHLSPHLSVPQLNQLNPKTG